ncbi:unnamed protein product [Angiostrongylus costaricensis]|uniref:Kinetochore protein NDC80 n=1 Tax=Angiostrongylus costaricensis TaxID=334426 RepID=A0A0R3PGW7_ANGCS|nr:unnamed protein product [Angiostrongylus costaricensis]
MIRKIYDFLLQHDGENCVPERVIRSPTKQDFIYMFESIYQHLSPNLQIKNVHEECSKNRRVEIVDIMLTFYLLPSVIFHGKVPAIFRELGYPTAIRPSTMQTIGASHTWPNLLGALTWLIEVVEKGSLESLREDIAQLDDDISKATHYKEETERDVNRLAEENNVVQKELEGVAKTMSEGQSRLAELEELTKVQEESTGLRSNEARELMAEFDQAPYFDIRNKLTMRKLKDELDYLCKQHWLAVPKSKRAFAEQHDRYHKLMLSIKNFHNFAHCEDAFMMDDNVEDERALHAAVSNVKALLGAIETGFVQRKWDMAQVIRQSIFELEPIKQEYNVVCGKFRQRQRMESRADRQRERDREDWNKDLMAAEADLAEKQSKISEEVSSRFHLIVSDLDKMNEARDWMMRTMKGFCDIKFPTDEGLLED